MLCNSLNENTLSHFSGALYSSSSEVSHDYGNRIEGNCRHSLVCLSNNMKHKGPLSGNAYSGKYGKNQVAFIQMRYYHIHAN